MLYRGEGASGRIRVRDLLISNFFESDNNYRVNTRHANVELGIACLEKMIEQPHFNICELEYSRLTNPEVKNLRSRIKETITDALQYSSLYWSNHLLYTPDTDNLRVRETLRRFVKDCMDYFGLKY
jgi:hypothetical protein